MASPVRDTLEAYVAGRVKAEHVVAVTTAEYYRDARSGMRDALRPVIEVIERASPGVVELSGTADRPGYDVRLAARQFPREYAAQLRAAVEAVLAGCVERAEPTHPASRIPLPGFWSWFRSLFSPST